MERKILHLTIVGALLVGVFGILPPCQAMSLCGDACEPVEAALSSPCCCSASGPAERPAPPLVDAQLQTQASMGSASPEPWGMEVRSFAVDPRGERETGRYGRGLLSWLGILLI